MSTGHESASRDGVPPQGRLIAGRYRLGERLGRGGMGTVWRAQDELLDREVAIKELSVGDLPTGELGVLHSRMKQEARAAARIKHPGVITIHDVLEQDGRPWIVMELVDGRSLAEVIQEEGTLRPRDAASVGAQVLAALDCAHRFGVLHRDVKPANVLLERGGRVVLTDFGIAMFEGSSGLTRTGDIVGSPDYLAPERVTGHRAGPESDLWSLGATLYAAVEGQSPFRRTSTLSTLQAVVADPLPEPRHAGPLAPVLEALLRKDPDQRPTAAQALRMLESVAAGTPVSVAVPEAVMAHPPTEVSTPVPDWARNPTVSTPPTPVYPPYGYPPAAPPVPPAPPAPGQPQAGGRRRRRTALLVVAAVVAVLLVAGLAYAFSGGGLGRQGRTTAGSSTGTTASATGAPGSASAPAGTGSAGQGGTPQGGASASAAAPPASTPAAAGSSRPGTAQGSTGTPAPAGYRWTTDPAGFRFAVPRGWTRSETNGQIDYSPDGGTHLLRFGITPAATQSSEDHFLELENTVGTLADYDRLGLAADTYQGRPGARWEFTWTDSKKGPRHAADQAFIAPDGTEYAIYVSSPADDWSAASAVFRTVLDTFTVS